MRLVVTGGHGKAGRYIVSELTSHPGVAVRVVDRTEPAEAGAIEQVCGDLSDLAFTEHALQGADAVVHVAAVPRPGLVPDQVCFANNVVTTYNVHEAAHRLGIRRLISIGSTAAMGWDWGRRDRLPQYLPLDEDHPLAPEDAYGLSKLIGEQISRSYHVKSGMESIVLRAPWIITPEEAADLQRAGGRQPGGFYHYAYIDARDLGRAVWAALQIPSPGHQVLFVAANDSTLAEPLAAVLPRESPALASMAGAITGLGSALSAERAKRLLNWEPIHSWRASVN